MWAGRTYLARVAPAARRRPALAEEAPELAPKTPKPPGATPQAAPLTGGCACGGGCPSCGGGPVARPPAASSTLPPDLRKRSEDVLGVPLSDVRLQSTGAVADQARARGADAAASGNVLAFPGGVPDLADPLSRFALGHELGHLARERGASALAPGEEAHADAAGERLSGIRRAAPPQDGGHPAPGRQDGQPVHFGIFDPIMDFIDDPVGYATAAAPGINAASLQVLQALPQNVLRLLRETRQASAVADAWTLQLVNLLTNWQGQQPLLDHLIAGAIEGAFVAGEVLGAVIDVFGVNAYAHALFVTSGALSPLAASEITASLRVHPPGLIPYKQILVDRGGIVARLAAIQGNAGSVTRQLLGGPGTQYRSVTTMHVIHTHGGTMSDKLAVHELTHVAQYTLEGAAYMAQALHAQLVGQGYDYTARAGSLANAIAAGDGFASFNREQQAMICEDYYETRHGRAARFGARLADLEYFVQDLWRMTGTAWPSGGP